MFEYMEGLAQALQEEGVDIADGRVGHDGWVIAGKLLYELPLASDASEILIDNLSLTDAVAIVFQGKAASQYVMKLNGEVGSTDYSYVGTYFYGSTGASQGAATNTDLPLSMNNSGTEETFCLALVDIVDEKVRYLTSANALGDTDTKEMGMLATGRSTFSATSITRISLLDTNGGDGFKAGSVVRLYQLG